MSCPVFVDLQGVSPVVHYSQVLAWMGLQLEDLKLDYSAHYNSTSFKSKSILLLVVHLICLSQNILMCDSNFDETMPIALWELKGG